MCFLVKMTYALIYTSDCSHFESTDFSTPSHVFNTLTSMKREIV